MDYFCNIGVHKVIYIKAPQAVLLSTFTYTYKTENILTMNTYRRTKCKGAP